MKEKIKKILKKILRNWHIIAEFVVIIWALVGLRKVIFNRWFVLFEMEGLTELLSRTDPVLMGTLYYLFSAVLIIYLIRKLARKIEIERKIKKLIE